MANSLKALLPAVGRILDETPDSLYASQRAFVRGGLLESVSGRGPGSGTPASPEAMAHFLIGICCHASRAEFARLAKGIARARSADGLCLFTGAKTFADALAAVLADEALTRRVLNVDIATTYGYAIIRYDGAKVQEGPEAFSKNPPKSTVFGGAPRREGLQFSALVPGEIILKLAGVLQ